MYCKRIANLTFVICLFVCFQGGTREVQHMGGAIEPREHVRNSGVPCKGIREGPAV